MRELLQMVLAGIPATIAYAAMLKWLIDGELNVGRGTGPFKVVRRKTDPFGYWLIVIFTGIMGTVFWIILIARHGGWISN